MFFWSRFQLNKRNLCAREGIFRGDALMHVGKLIFAQLTEFLPQTTFSSLCRRYGGEHKIKRLTCREQFLCLAFAQLAYRKVFAISDESIQLTSGHC
jgi:hypothetical protein